MTLLASKQAAAKAAPAPAKPETILARARAASPRGEYVEMPILGRVWVELAGELVVDEIEGEVFAAMAALGLQPVPTNMLTYDSRRTALTLAWAVRDPDSADHAVRAGTAQQWLEVDIDLLSACGQVYGDVRERLNPVGSSSLTDEEYEQIRLAHEKKNAAMLRTFGLASLSNYLATTDAPPASSPTPPPSPGPS